jgi:hypothetical protein
MGKMYCIHFQFWGLLYMIFACETAAMKENSADDNDNIMNIMVEGSDLNDTEHAGI